MNVTISLRLALVTAAVALMSAIAVPASAQAPAPADIPPWLSRISLGGDLYFRAQRTLRNTGYDELASMRLRLGASVKLTEQLTGNLRLTSADPTNTINTSVQTEGAGWAKKNFWLDITSLDYKPIDGLVLTVGKAVNPFYTAARNEMVWGANVNPEGVSAKYTTELGAFKPFIAVSHFIVTDNGTNKADNTMAGAQIGTSMKLEPVAATIAVGSYTYNGLKGSTAITPTTTSGNTLTGGAYANDYKLTDIEAELSVDVFGLPVTAYGGYVQNSDPSTKNKGTLGGLRIGKVAAPGSWAINYNYRDVEADATLAPYVETDQGGTNVRGNRVNISYSLAPGVVAGLTGLWLAPSTGSGFTERYYVDLNATF